MHTSLEQPDTMIDFARKIRAEFPLLGQTVNNRPLVYLDNAATTQKPEAVIRAIDDYYRNYNSNVHRGVHHLSQVATNAMETARADLASLIGAARAEEVVFTAGTTGSINLVANVLGRAVLKPGDEVLISEMEHHSNIVPWQLACEISGAVLKVIPVLDDGSLDMDAFFNLLTHRTRIVAVVHISNSLGTINPVKLIVEKAKEAGALILIDGAQAIAHQSVNVQELGCDFYAFSGHKMYGPTGIGVLYGRYDLLAELPPYQGGGEMIDRVTFEQTTYNAPPFRFEAGTPNIAGIIGMGAAAKWLLEKGAEQLAAWESVLLQTATEKLNNIPNFIPVGTAAQKANVVAFNLKGTHHYDLGVLLDKMGFALRTGHHCTQPLMQKFGIEGTVRASFAPYNTPEEIDALAEAIQKAQQMLA